MGAKDIPDISVNREITSVPNHPFTPQKTSTTIGKALRLPLLDVLKQLLDATALGQETFLDHGSS